MTLPPFNPRRTEAPKAEPGEGDDVPCVKCGAVALDTGLECSECGHDNYEAVTGRPFGVPGTWKPTMPKHPDCAEACQQAVDYGMWDQHCCSPACVRLKHHPFGVDSVDGGKNNG